MIDLEELAYAFNAVLGTDDFLVYLNSNAYPDDIGARNVVTMTALRIPFGFTREELDAESLTVTLTFDLPCDVRGERAVVRGNALETIEKKLLGRQRFRVEQADGTTYIVNTFFEQQPPANPYADSGGITQQIVVSGKALAQNCACKALVGNDVLVSVSADGKNYTRLLKVTRVATAQTGTDANVPLSEETTLPCVRALSRTHTKALTFLYTGLAIENEFLKIAEGAPFDVNKVYYYKVEYPDFALIVPFLLLSVSSQDSAGVYLQYTLNVQTVEDARETAVE
ncbi:MAG: hypothetical protein IJB34_04425 [Clostridia bacterium]|nr:hypothetical protein [Clostridia bacterium]